MGRLLIIVGVLVAAVGVAVELGLPLGRLPGDLVIRRGSTTVYLPVVTCLVLSVVLSIVAAVLRR
jgi:uncharacterized protein HemY